MITIGELKGKIEGLGYVATEELIYDTFNALCMYADGEVNPGQDIFAICLEGPPGAGKTQFAKTYTELANQIFNGNVEMVDYQCDATTGKTELFEDINISAAIRGDADHVNIPGKLIEAIKKVNTGKKVVLFIDEYDKAREETDAFLLQFLQSGKINSTQHGDLEIKDEYKSNLQVILCKNDNRQELSGPLSRRIRIIRLDYMIPSTFYKVAKRVLVDEKKDKVNDGLLNLVSLMYQHAYESKEIFNRLPSCSEMLIAIEDADRLMKRANAPQSIIYKVIINNMFKSLDDIETFETGIDKVNNDTNKKLSSIIKSMKNTQQASTDEDINSLIAEHIFKDKNAEFNEKIKEMENLISEYKARFAEMEKKRQETIDRDNQNILLKGGQLKSTINFPNLVKNFMDESFYIRRGANILELSNDDWTDVGEIIIPNFSHYTLIEKLVENASALGVIIYENGILLQNSEEQHLIVVNEPDEQNKSRYRIMANYPIIPSTYLSDVENFISFATEVYRLQKDVNIADGQFSINALVYNDTSLNSDLIRENVYNVNITGNIAELSELKQVTSVSSCKDPNNALTVSNEIMNVKRKILANE